MEDMGTITVHVSLPSGEQIFGPEAVSRNAQIQGIRRRLETQRSTGAEQTTAELLLDGRVLADNETFQHNTDASIEIVAIFSLVHLSSEELTNYKAEGRDRNKKHVLGNDGCNFYEWFASLPAYVRANGDLVKFAASIELTTLEHAHPSALADEEVVLSIVALNGMALQYIDVDLREDFVIAETAVGQTDEAISCLGPSRSGDKAFIVKIVTRTGHALQYASERMRSDPEVVEAAVSQNGSALRHATMTLRADQNFMLTQVHREGLALQFASDALKSDKLFVEEAVRLNVHALHFAAAELRADFGFMSAHIRRDWRALAYAGESLTRNREVVLLAIGQSGYALEYVSDTLKVCPHIVLEAVRQNGGALQYASISLRSDRKVTSAAVRQTKTGQRFVIEPITEDSPRCFLLRLMNTVRALALAVSRSPSL